MNCLMYLPLPSGQSELTHPQCLQILAMRDYADEHNLHITDYLDDREGRPHKTRCARLRRIIAKNGNIAAILATVEQMADPSDFAVLRDVIPTRRLLLMVIPSRA